MTATHEHHGACSRAAVVCHASLLSPTASPRHNNNNPLLIQHKDTQTMSSLACARPATMIAPKLVAACLLAVVLFAVPCLSLSRIACNNVKQGMDVQGERAPHACAATTTPPPHRMPAVPILRGVIHCRGRSLPELSRWPAQRQGQGASLLCHMLGCSFSLSMQGKCCKSCNDDEDCNFWVCSPVMLRM